MRGQHEGDRRYFLIPSEPYTLALQDHAHSAGCLAEGHMLYNLVHLSVNHIVGPSQRLLAGHLSAIYTFLLYSTPFPIYALQIQK